MFADCAAGMAVGSGWTSTYFEGKEVLSGKMGKPVLTRPGGSERVSRKWRSLRCKADRNRRLWRWARRLLAPPGTDERKPPQLSGGFSFIYDLLKHCNQIV